MINGTNAGLQSQQITFIAQVTAVRAIHSGMLGITNSFQELGLINAQTANDLKMLTAAVNIVLASFQLLKGVTEIIDMLKDAEIAEAAVASYRAVLANPLAIGLVSAGLGAAAGVGAYAMMQPAPSQQTTVNQTVNFAGTATSDTRSAAVWFVGSDGGF